MYYPCSDNKGADQLRSYREAGLRLCFRIRRLLVFSLDGSLIYLRIKLFALFYSRDYDMCLPPSLTHQYSCEASL